MKKKLLTLFSNKKLKLLAPSLGLLLLIVVLGLVYVAFSKDKQAIPKEEPLITYSTDQPDESKSNVDAYKWRGSADEPKKIRINSLSVDSYIQKAGVDQNNKVAVPSNVHLAGWFADSVKPGQNGLSIIAGHVSGRQTDGVFKELDRLAIGDEFEIELGSGTIKKYKVIDTKQMKEADSAKFLFDQKPDVKSQVNLITCGGSFDSNANQYEDRIIVFGEMIN